MSKISAGSYDLNTWLHGGYETDIITVIYGPSGSGKTNFCMLAAVSQAKKGNKVIFVDTEGGFSTERVKQLAADATQQVLQNTILLKPTNFTEQKEAFKNLLTHVNKEAIKLIIVDGMTILYRLDFATAREKDYDEIKKTNTLLVQQLRTLAEIARKQQIPIILTNQVYQWDNASKMVGGDMLTYWGKCLIELTHDKGKRIAHLRKHRSLPPKELEFQITNTGIKKRGWI